MLRNKLLLPFLLCSTLITSQAVSDDTVNSYREGFPSEQAELEKPKSQIGKYQISVLAGLSHFEHSIYLLDTETGQLWRRDHTAAGYYDWKEIFSPVESK